MNTSSELHRQAQRLLEQLPTEILRQIVELLEVLQQEIPATSDPQPDKRVYDFSDLVGRLEWKGNALQTQRALRDEW